MSAHRSGLFAAQQRRPHIQSTSALSGREVEEEIQRENDGAIEAVGVDMSRLKMTAISLRDEAAEHNRLLDTLQSAVTIARDGVGGVVGKFDSVMARYGYRHTMLLGILIFSAAVVVWMLAKHYRPHE